MSEGKKTPKNKPTSKKYSKYTIEGDKIVSKEKTCPRCGPGVFLMKATNRLYCGRCHYTEFTSSEKKVEAPKEAEKVEEKKE
jgi:ubiquitin-small subunit ribosomal protein S27Ae